MAQPESVSQDHIDAVGTDLRGLLHVGANGIGTMVHIDGTAVHEPQPTFGPAFSVWTIPYKNIVAGAADKSDIGAVAAPTGRLHHQMILQNALAYARSAETPTQDAPTLLEFSTSPLADAVAAAFAWVQAHVTGDPRVRLLELPSYQTHALWLWNEAASHTDGVVVVSAPDFIGLPRETVLSSADFLEPLARAKPLRGKIRPR